MNCPKYGCTMQIYCEIIDPKVTVYICPKWGNKESQ